RLLRLASGFAPLVRRSLCRPRLSACAPVTRIASEDYPKAFLQLAHSRRPGAWLYTGGLENRPDLVRRMAASRPLWGNDATVLRQVRSPFRVAALLQRERLPCPAVWADPSEAPAGAALLV